MHFEVQSVQLQCRVNSKSYSAECTVTVTIGQIKCRVLSYRVECTVMLQMYPATVLGVQLQCMVYINSADCTVTVQS